MKLHRIANYAATMVALVGLPLFAPRVHAAPVMLGQINLQIDGPNQPVPVEWNDERRHQLRHIYWELEGADADYNGHKREALEHIRKAAEMMGLDLHGEGYDAGQKPQDWSDRKLRQARDQLSNLVERSGGREQDHLRSAVKELDHALETR